MGEEPLHWSERAKTTSPGAFPPTSLRNQPPPRTSRTKMVLTLGSILTVLAVIVAVVVVMFPRSESPNPTASGFAVDATSTTVAGTTTSTSERVTPTTRAQAKSPVTSIYSSAGVFEDLAHGISFTYPKSWKEFPLEGTFDPNDPPDVSFAVGDPQGSQFNGVPMNFIVAAFGPFTESEIERGAESLLKEIAGTWTDPETTGGAGKILEAVQGTEINGMTAAETTIQYSMGSLVVVQRLCLILSGDSGCVFVMSTDKRDLEKNWPLFETTLQSFQLSVGNLQV